MDLNGKQVIAAKYQASNQFHNGLAAVRLDNLWGYIDPTGEVVIAPQFSAATDFNENGLEESIPEEASMEEGEIL